MKRQIIKLVCTAGLIFTVSHASASSSSGIIRFVGAIVEPACEVSSLSQTVTAQCWRQGEMHTSTAAQWDKPNMLPQKMGYMESRSLAPNAKLIVVNYH
ncbi:hypothetical protein BIY29_00945 [Brenneria alni]|uniref:Type 1 fimbrial protein n=1 Tax=Brenneria alni TaxID=71656 RepID=A0A421DU65_9GAMM|nr:type 1 fimbrial protein [Brenneria alni]RLM28252.1 hypothetical protein BIY29_00945 [Brenneria alni]